MYKLCVCTVMNVYPVKRSTLYSVLCIKHTFISLFSGSSKPKSFLEIQQEQEGDFGSKVATTTQPQSTSGGGGGGVTTPTANKLAKVHVHVLLYTCTPMPYCAKSCVSSYELMNLTTL